jgi:NADPH-dependent curcumin reductase CurA
MVRGEGNYESEGSPVSANRKIVIARLPEGPLTAADFRLVEEDLPRPGAGEVLVRVILASVDPAQRVWLIAQGFRAEHPEMALEDGHVHVEDEPEQNEVADFTRRAQPLRDIREVLGVGDVMTAFTLGEVVDANGTDLPKGTIVACVAGWQEYAAVNAGWARPIEVRTALTRHLGVLGITGLTAYFGIELAQPKAGETVVISAAAGGVGTVAGQLARIAGARVVGLTRSAQKNRVLERELGFDATVDYRSASFAQDLAAACPDGVDVYFDSVGGPLLETMIDALNVYGRVSCCGFVSEYQGAKAVGPANVPSAINVKRLRIQGYSVTDFLDEWPEAERRMAAWLDSGELRVLEDIVEGLEHAPGALVGLLAGDNIGKRTIRVAPDPA